jgi:hypothetical protein
MAKFTYIYGLVDPRNDSIRYVGKSDDPVRRSSQHIKCACRGDNRPVCRWIRKLRSLGMHHRVAILEQTAYDAWKERECYWIDTLGKAGRLLNVAKGGIGGNPLSAQTKAKIAKRTKERMEDPENRRQIVSKLRGRTRTYRDYEQYRQRVSAALLGKKRRPMSEEGKHNIAKALRGNTNTKGRKLSPEHVEAIRTAALNASPETRAKIAAAHAHAYVVLFPDGHEEHIRNLAQFCRDHGLIVSCMVNVANGKHGRTQHKGFRVYPVQ